SVNRYVLRRGSRVLGIRVMDAETSERFNGIDRRFDAVDQRLDGIDRRLGGIDQRLDGMDQRFDGSIYGSERWTRRLTRSSTSRSATSECGSSGSRGSSA